MVKNVEANECRRSTAISCAVPDVCQGELGDLAHIQQSRRYTPYEHEKMPPQSIRLAAG